MHDQSYIPELMILSTPKSFGEFNAGDLIDLATRSDSQDELFILVRSLGDYRHMKALIPQVFATGELTKPIVLQHRDFETLNERFDP